ncbi:hypothetical protein D3C87_1261100 [compost metagenome]
MKTTTQISLILGAILAIGFIKHRSSEKKSQSREEQIPVEYKKTQPAPAFKKTLVYTQNQKDLTAKNTNLPIAEIPTTRSPHSNSISESMNIDIDRDLGLDNKIIDDLSFLFSIEKRECDFLLHEVRVTPEKYQKIQQQRKIVQWQLKQIDRKPAAQGRNQQQFKNAILAKHVYWMQSEIGVGYYNRLQEISLGMHSAQ